MPAPPRGQHIRMSELPPADCSEICVLPTCSEGVRLGYKGGGEGQAGRKEHRGVEGNRRKKTGREKGEKEREREKRRGGRGNPQRHPKGMTK